MTFNAKIFFAILLTLAFIHGYEARIKRQAPVAHGHVSSWENCKPPKNQRHSKIEVLQIGNREIPLPGSVVIPLLVKVNEPLIGPVSATVQIKRNIFFDIKIPCVKNAHGHSIGSCDYQNFCRPEVMLSKFLACRHEDDCICKFNRETLENGGEFPAEVELPLKLNILSLPGNASGGLIKGEYKMKMVFHQQQTTLMCVQGKFIVE